MKNSDKSNKKRGARKKAARKKANGNRPNAAFLTETAQHGNRPNAAFLTETAQQGARSSLPRNAPATPADRKNGSRPKTLQETCSLTIKTTPLSGGEITSVKPWKPKKKRVWELDFLRGLAILLVAMDHTFYDMWAMFGDLWATNPVLSQWSLFAHSYWTGSLREFWKPFFLFVFFFVSGISSGFSRNNLFRSFKLVGAALFINLATFLLDNYLGMQGSFIKFGVIQCFAVIVLIYAIIELLVRALTFRSEKLRKRVISAICLAIGITVLVVNEKYNASVMGFELRHEYANVTWDSPLAALFFYVKESWALPSADYFPLFPFLGYFMLGAGLTNVLYPEKKSLLPFLDGYRRLPVSGKRVYVGWWHKIFTVPGRYSLIIYILWQVVAVGILGAVTLAVFGELPFF